MPDIFERLKLRRLVNVSGTETPFGGAPAATEVLAAATELARHSVYMSELQTAACDVIARATGADAGCVTGCTAASISVSVAATMTGTDLALAERLPDVTGLKDEVVMQHGHEVTYGQIVSQNIRLTGGRVVKIGAATQCSAYQLRDALTSQTTAAFFVVSPLTVQERLIPLKTFCEICHHRGVPVIVDAASQPEARPYLDAGGDLVLLSGQKALEGLTAGIIAGRMELVRACMYQMHGIGRPMKAGKEGVIGVIAALERWMCRDVTRNQAAVAARTQRARDRLGRMTGVNARIAGQQLVLAIDSSMAGLTAHQISVALTRQSPSIVVWDQFAAIGELRLTFRLVDDDIAEYVCGAVEAVLGDVARFSRFEREPQNPGDRTLAQLNEWPQLSFDQISIADDR